MLVEILFVLIRMRELLYSCCSIGVFELSGTFPIESSGNSLEIRLCGCQLLCTVGEGFSYVTYPLVSGNV